MKCNVNMFSDRLGQPWVKVLSQIENQCTMALKTGHTLGSNHWNLVEDLPE